MPYGKNKISLRLILSVCISNERLVLLNKVSTRCLHFYNSHHNISLIEIFILYICDFFNRSRRGNIVHSNIKSSLLLHSQADTNQRIKYHFSSWFHAQSTHSLYFERLCCQKWLRSTPSRNKTLKSKLPMNFLLCEQFRLQACFTSEWNRTNLCPGFISYAIAPLFYISLI